LQTVWSHKQCEGQGLTSRLVTLTAMNYLQRSLLGFLGSNTTAVQWCIHSLQTNKLCSGDAASPCKVAEFTFAHETLNGIHCLERCLLKLEMCFQGLIHSAWYHWVSIMFGFITPKQERLCSYIIVGTYGDTVSYQLWFCSSSVNRMPVLPLRGQYIFLVGLFTMWTLHVHGILQIDTVMLLCLTEVLKIHGAQSFIAIQKIK